LIKNLEIVERKWNKINTDHWISTGNLFNVWQICFDRNRKTRWHPLPRGTQYFLYHQGTISWWRRGLLIMGALRHR